MVEEKRRKAEYRSSIRSKTLIRNALVSLMQEKPFEKITITDIVRRADINRGTFYAHFRDSREVLERIRSDALSEMKDAIYSIEADSIIRNPRPLLEKISSFLSEDSTYYRMLLSTAGIQEFLGEVKKIVIEYLLGSEYAARQHDRDALLSRMDFHVSAISGIYYDIVIGAVPLTLEAAPSFIISLLKVHLPR